MSHGIVITAAGPVELERPRVHNAREVGFESRILGKHVARTYALESLIICSFLRGLSVLDVEAALEETFEQPVIGKSTIARVCQDKHERYRRWRARRLEEHDLVYLFCDALDLELRPDPEQAERLLVAWMRACPGRAADARSRRRAGAQGETPPSWPKEQSWRTASAVRSLLRWTIRSSAARGPQLRNRAIAMRHKQ
jgi:hypothetical protein